MLLLAVLLIVVSMTILLIVELPVSTFDCDSHLHSFLLLYSLTVLLFLIPPGSLFDSDTP